MTDLRRHEKFEDCISGIIYEFNLIMFVLHNMFLDKNISPLHSKRKSYDIANGIAIHYKDKITYVKTLNADSNIGYSHLFPPQKKRKQVYVFY